MGEVYRAVDTKLERDVAIKVLPAALAADAERLARFEREAKVLAQLNHPGIATIHGVEDRALVMELVPGPTLADRIQQGPIPAGEAEEILLQIADAIEYAHERGVIHTDLKPANITDGAYQPFFSHDGHWVGFFSRGRQLNKISVEGGAVVPLSRTPVRGPSGASWGEDGGILMRTSREAMKLHDQGRRVHSRRSSRVADEGVADQS